MSSSNSTGKKVFESSSNSNGKEVFDELIELNWAGGSRGHRDSRQAATAKSEIREVSDGEIREGDGESDEVSSDIA